MVTYFDSSVILTMLLDEPTARASLEVWDAASIRVSSILLEAECLVSLRRVARTMHAQLAENWLSDREAKLLSLLQTVFLSPLDEPVMKVVRAERELARCRASDALHLATALLASARSGMFQIVTRDGAMHNVATLLKIKAVNPDDVNGKP